MNDDKLPVMFEVTAARSVTSERGTFVDPERRISAHKVVETVMSMDLEAMSAKVSDMVDRFSSAFVPKPGGPKETEIEFAISLTADGSVVFASLGSTISMKVKVKLDRE
jgi:hypothetical protein